MANWRVAKSLLALREQVNAKYPTRNKADDGTIGDTSHQATHSDHNPDENGVVKAMDLTHDPRGGFDSYKFADAVLQSKDPRVRYVISNSRIGGNEGFYKANKDTYNLPGPWRFGRYHGKNPHDRHVHVSVVGDPHLYDDDRPWAAVSGVPIAPPAIEPLPPSQREREADNFPAALKLVLAHEGGNDDDPDDPGGRTSRGITQSEWDRWRIGRKDLGLDVWLAPQAEVEAIYRQRYWDALHCDDLPAGVDYCVFDFGVNSGNFRAAKFLQLILGVAADGQIGPITIAAANKATPGYLINSLCDHRLNYLKGLSTWWKYKRGWTTRVGDVRRDALAMANA